MRRAEVNKILFLTGFWTLAAVFIVSYDTAVLNSVANGSEPANYLRDLAIGGLITLVVGATMASFEVLVLSRKLRKRPYGTLLLTKTLFYLGCMLVFISLAVILIASF